VHALRISETSLWRNPSFVRLWVAKTLSALGSHVTGAAIPITAVFVLGASPGQMAALVFASQLPDLLFGLLAGVWVDRVRRRHLMMGADLGRAALLLTIPIGAMTGWLSLELLWIVAFGCASLSLVFTLAAVAILPAVVRTDQLVDANAKMHMSDAVLSLAGPGFAGFLIQLVTAPKAILADVASFLASAWALGGVGGDDRVATPEHAKTGLAAIRHEIGEGLVELVRTPVLRALAISMGLIVAGGAVSQTVIVIYYATTLGLTPFAIATLAAFGGLGALAGAAVASKVADWTSVGMAIVLAGFLEAAALFMVPMAQATDAPVTLLATSGVLSGIAYSVLSINQISLRQRVTPVRLLGRVTAARRFVIFLIGPIGAAAGGILGTKVGLEATLVVAAVVTLAGALVQYLSPIRHAR
jgi:hypothetical protein